jgi:hypothetical protein
MAIKIELEFSDKDAADLLCSVIENNIAREWCLEIDADFSAKQGPRAKPWGADYTPGYIAAPFTEGACLIVRVHSHWVGQKINDTDRTIAAEYRLARKELAAGLAAMAAKHPIHFAALLNGQADALTGDVFLQCCTMGEIVFG